MADPMAIRACFPPVKGSSGNLPAHHKRRRIGNPRYSRLGNLRYRIAYEYARQAQRAGHPRWPARHPAITEHWWVAALLKTFDRNSDVRFDQGMAAIRMQKTLVHGLAHSQLFNHSWP
jgi:hypothetical protein